jgi:poly(A) polymerase
VRFTEDPVRMLRAVRFAAMLGFTIEDATWEALAAQSATITRSAPPRLYEEILKLFLSGEGEKSYQLLRRSGLLAALFPGFSDWLDRESDGFPHTRIGQALDWIDRLIREGEKVPPQLLLALIFGEYLEELGERFRRDGATAQQSLDMAVVELLGELTRTVLIPYKVGMLVRDILSCQHRFRKTPGKRPLSFISRPFFAAAHNYLHFTSSTTGDGMEIYLWWKKFALSSQPQSAGEPGEKHEPKQSLAPTRSKRRRRKHRPPRVAEKTFPETPD